jgi:hypothetical protein
MSKRWMPQTTLNSPPASKQGAKIDVFFPDTIGLLEKSDKYNNS